MRWLYLAAFSLCAFPLPAQVPPEKAEATLKVADGLTCKLFASEPMFTNPTSMDIDEQGRVWVCESVNYRYKLRNKPINRAEGDRIVILTDSDGDGTADKASTFYQAPDFLAPLGIAVLRDPKAKGYKVWVCHSPHIYLFEDKDADGKADGPPSIFLTGFKGFDHDHGVHGIHFGPDGMLYFSVGDQGVDGLKDKNGKVWKTNQTDCKAGTIWRVKTDGTALEMLAHNFRNQYEPAINSFGTMFVSDNDDDGNEQTRICHVMYGGDYGYWPRRKGDHHWHENEPGVVHKVTRTGFGSPTGLCWYEGKLLNEALLNLLPQKDKNLYKGLLLHTDAGPRELRLFGIKAKGSGYETDKVNLVTSGDNWFRPSDVTVAPDGSIFIADWYDPGVGGHGMGDTTRGRIYRLSTKEASAYKFPEPSLKDAEGIQRTLTSPNIATRQMVVELCKHGELSGELGGNKFAGLANNAMFQARGNFALCTHPDFQKTIAHLVRTIVEIKRSVPTDKSKEEAGLFYLEPYYPDLATLLPEKNDFILFLNSIKNKHALLPWLRNTKLEHVQEVFWTIAREYDGSDRYLLSALNIALGTDPARRKAILKDFDKHYPDWNDTVASMVWEFRPEGVIAKLPAMLQSDKYTPKQKEFMFDILAGSEDPEIGKQLLKVIAAKESSKELQTAATKVMSKHLVGKWAGLRGSEETTTAIRRMFAWPFSTPLAMDLVTATERAEFLPNIIKVIDDKDPGFTAEMKKQAIDALSKFNHPDSLKKLTEMLQGEQYVAAIAALGNVKQVSSQETLEKRLSEKPLRSGEAEAIVSALASSRNGTQWLLGNVAKLNECGMYDHARRVLTASPFQDLRNRALMVFASASSKLDMKKLASLTELAKKKGDINRGKKLVMENKDLACARCHTINNEGGKIGPDLSQIGTKASRDNLLESILYPDKAIADQFVQYLVENKKGELLTGLIVEETPERIIIRDANGKDTTVALKDIVEKKKQTKSLMPDDLHKYMTEQDLIDMMEYMATLKKP